MSLIDFQKLAQPRNGILFDNKILEGANEMEKRSYTIRIKSPADFFNTVKYQENSEFEVQREVLQDVFGKVFKDILKKIMLNSHISRALTKPQLLWIKMSLLQY